jgi:phytoene dehydrogenase-like protein
MTERSSDAPEGRRHVAVVGAGLAGLVAACVAAQAGAAVTLLEAARAPGGRAMTRTRDGYSFNQGPHALYRAGPGMPVLHALGVTPDGAPAPSSGLCALDAARLAPDGGHLVHAARYLAPDAPADRDRLQGELEALMDRVQPGWRAAVAQRRFAPDLRVADGLPAAEAGGLCGRPAVDAPAAPGVFLAGDWVGPKGLLSDAARVSGDAAGRRAAGCPNSAEAAEPH